MWNVYKDMSISKNNGTPKSSMLIGFSIIFTIHFGIPLYLETPVYRYEKISTKKTLHGQNNPKVDLHFLASKLLHFLNTYRLTSCGWRSLWTMNQMNQVNDAHEWCLKVVKHSPKTDMAPTQNTFPKWNSSSNHLCFRCYIHFQGYKLGLPPTQ